MTTDDLAGREYWEASWLGSADVVPPVGLSDDLDDYPTRAFHDAFQSVLPPALPGQRLLELGCARSVWLPYFAQHFRYAVTGIDYTALGCELARRQLAAEGVAGDVVQADFFDPPDELLGSFDVVVSFGVAEHFSDTAQALHSFARYLRPGGLLITVVPNLAGAIGVVQKRINRRVYDVHVPLDREALAEAHQIAGLDVLDARYLMPANFGVLNLEGLDRGTFRWWGKRALVAALARSSRRTWQLHRRTGYPRPRRVLAPYALCVARLRQPAPG